MSEIILSIHVTPGSRQNKLLKIDSLFANEPPTWKAWVAAPPEDGKANDALLRLVAENLGVPKSCVQIIKGHTSRRKTVKIQMPG